MEGSVVEPAAPDRLHRLMMELVRVIGLVELDRAVAGQPISLSQAFALHELDADVPLSQRVLAERLHLEKSSVSRMAAEMERYGLLVRERHPDNRRLYRLRLTARGRRLHREIAAAFHQRYVHWTSAMTAAELDALLAGLVALVRAVRDDTTK
jgi:DNA-binding MarR family transcriptional regulator